MTARLDEAWLRDPATRRVLAALEAEGGAGCARFVGGCVRNALMGRPVDDIDLATTLTPDRTERALKAAGLKSVPTGIAHGTVTAVADGKPFEITTLRRDVSTDGRNATVAFTDDWAEDAARRDFRLNALYADADGRVFDPVGRGVEDALAGRIVFVGDPETRIREDYLRILRFFRFRAWYGRGPADAAALKACAALAPGMTRLSAERVGKEMLKLLAAPDPAPALAEMAEAGVLAQVAPEAVWPATLGDDGDPVGRLMRMLPPEVEAVHAAARRLRLPNAARDRMADAARAWADVLKASDARAVRAAVWTHGTQAVLDTLARREAHGEPVSPLIEAAVSWTRPSLPVGGRDTARLGVPPGPETGRVLKAFEASWVAADFPTDGHEARLREVLGSRF